MSRHGFALAAVLFALTVLAGAAATALVVALNDNRSAQSRRDLLRARRGAQSAFAEVLASWDVLVLNALGDGERSASAVTASAGVTVTAEVRRLNYSLFLVRGDAESPSAHVSLVQPVRLDAIETAPAALRARAVDPALSSWIDGVDHAVPGWTCTATNDTVPAPLLQPGTPDSVFLRFGRRDWGELAAWADSVPPGGDSLAVQHSATSLTINGGRRLGVLVVDGDLWLAGGAQMVGLVLVRGALRFEGLGGSIRGAAVASQVISQNGFIPATPVVVFSSCAVLRSVFSRANPVPMFGIHSVVMY